MGFVTQFFIKPSKAPLIQLPKGSFTINREGQVMTSTLPRPFMAEHAQAIAQQVLATFKSAEKLELPFNEFALEFETMRLIARNLKGGAMIFLVPQGSIAKPVAL